MYKWHQLLLLGSCVLLAGGCNQHILTDYRPLDRAGMWSSNIEQLKAINTSDAEVVRLVKLKQAGLSDDACVALVAAAREKQHPFFSGGSTSKLVSPRLSETQNFGIANVHQLDS